MKDLRTRGGVPFGYSIQNGDAVINKEEAKKLLGYFENFLTGLSMAEAAREAGLSCDTTTLPHLFFRREYTGTDFYPPLITEEYRSQLIAERTRRKGASLKPNRKKLRQVRIHTDFGIDKKQRTLPEDPIKYIEAMFELIVPKTTPMKNSNHRSNHFKRNVRLKENSNTNQRKHASRRLSAIDFVELNEGDTTHGNQSD